MSEITKAQENLSIDLMVTDVVEEISRITNKDKDVILTEFLNSKTGKLLYDESSKLWWSGPSEIVDMYMQEIADK